MSSTRLPGKIFKEINHKKILQYHIERLVQAGFDIAIATTLNESDDCVCEFAEKNNINYFRESENNVLSRYYETAKKFNADIIVRVTSDCPLIDPHLITESVKKYKEAKNQNLYLTNVIERTFARGFDFEVFSFSLLEEANRMATEEFDLEHVTPYIWKNRSGKVEYYHVKQPVDNSNLRVTLDTPEDFELIRILIEKYKADQCSSEEIENILINNPALVSINAHIEQKRN